jgi:hypothetical protein
MLQGGGDWDPVAAMQAAAAAAVAFWVCPAAGAAAALPVRPLVSLALVYVPRIAALPGPEIVQRTGIMPSGNRTT